MSDRMMFIDAVINATGLPYEYGSNGPDSVDCSGLVVMAMRKRWSDFEDRTAANLFDHYKAKVAPALIQPGCLLFFNKFSHVVTCIRSLAGGVIVLQGANGGTPLCKTVEDAYHSKAIVGPEYGKILNGVYTGWWASAYCGAVDPFEGQP